MSNKDANLPGAAQWRVRGPRDFYGGLALIGLAALAFWLSSDLVGMQGATLGPGTAPRLAAGLLAFVGALVAIGGLMFDGPPLEGYALRGPAYVIAAIAIFALMLGGFSVDLFGSPVRVPRLGLVLSTFCAFVISVMGSREKRWLEGLAAAAAMTVFCVIVFVYLLQLPFELWPSL
jgi:putative tricarboxylic transport membrane protein